MMRAGRQRGGNVRMAMLVLSLVASIVLLESFCAGAAPTLAKLQVTVVSAIDGKPIVGAKLHIPSVRRDFTTDLNGSVTIETLKAGSCQIEVTAPGKAKVVKTVRLSAT